jgi:hypothetical protein
MKKPSSKLIATICYFFIITNSAFAGSGYYVGADLVKNFVKISGITSTTATGFTESAPIQKSEKSNDYGLRFGYKHKINKYNYISPEFFYNRLNGGYLYSTTMKFGVEIKDLSLFGSLGYSENNKFNGSSENYGLGLEYKIDDNFSISSEYIKYGDVKFDETSVNGAITTNIQKNQQLQTFKIGITYYFHE